MKKTLLALLFFIIGIAAVYLYLLWQKQTAITSIAPPAKKGTAPFIFSFDEAPTDALKAIATSSGTVMWTARTATMPAELTPGTALVQGEDIETGEAATAALSFQNSAAVSMEPATRIEISQSLPQNIVFRQTAGKATFVSGTSPVTVRILHLIATTIGGTMEVSLDNDTGRAVIKADKGTLRLGFNDLDYQSVTQTLAEGESYLFDDATLTGKVE